MENIKNFENIKLKFANPEVKFRGLWAKNKEG